MFGSDFQHGREGQGAGDLHVVRGHGASPFRGGARSGAPGCGGQASSPRSANSSTATKSTPSASLSARAEARVNAQRRKWGATFLFVFVGVASPESAKVPKGNTATAWARLNSASL